MADLLTTAQLNALIDLEDEILGLGRPNQCRYSEDIVRRLAEILGPATGMDVQKVITAAGDNPWTMWVALITALDNEAAGYIFQSFSSWWDWEVVILNAFLTQPPEKPGVPPEWIIRRLARIIDLELPLVQVVLRMTTGMGTEQALAETPLFTMLVVIDFIDFFYSF